MTDSSQNQLAANVAHALIAEMAPQELPLFRANSQAYFKDPQSVLKEEEGRDDMLGFGTGEAIALLTPIALAVSAEVVKFLGEEIKKSLKTESSSLIADQVNQLFKKYRPAAANKETPKPAALTMEQLREVHQVAFTRARQLRVGESRAKQLADALIANLVTS